MEVNNLLIESTARTIDFYIKELRELKQEIRELKTDLSIYQRRYNDLKQQNDDYFDYITDDNNFRPGRKINDIQKELKDLTMPF